MKSSIKLVGIMGFTIFLFTAGIQAQSLGITISPGDTTVDVGNQVQYTAVLLDSNNTQVDTTLGWALSGDSIGNLTQEGLFTANSPGKAYVIASIGDLADSSEIEVAETEVEIQEDEWTITLFPSDTTLLVGDSLLFAAEITDTAGNVIDTVLAWSLNDNILGEIDSTGLFVAAGKGLGFISASLGEHEGKTSIYVQDSSADTTGVQTVYIVRPKKNPNAPPDTLEIPEGGSYKLKGFQYPLNVLNGGVLLFPYGSLNEDITLTISMPEFVKGSGQDSLEYPTGIAAAASFDVSVNDSVVSPYYFEVPVNLSLPFKRGLLRHLGLSPYDLGMFFYSEDSGYDSTGIADIVVDSSTNRIFGSVAHFTNVVLAKKENVTVSVDGSYSTIPRGYTLSQNYPNPFNPSTIINFELPKPAFATLTVFDLLGRQMSTLVAEELTAGKHVVLFRPNGLVSGVYFYRLQTAEFSQTKKLILMR